MKLTIWTHWEGKVWEGEIPDGQVPATTDKHGELEYVFRFFNRVDEEDVERLEALGYDLPSLSVDDRVTLPDGSVWVVGPIGWVNITADLP